ncbi:formin-binding protein 1-like isoform X3 [Dreissena polymorpha]|uniref:formin-binding protein 1-like isoform X3 n=1 Tax=Dreissena polymorpha TaxID=45954 RepID=UPI0022640B29|nr:formin-binding protein 1-like isoform X3 [Dreissena polymorpha]
MSKYKVTEKYSFNTAEGGDAKVNKKYRRKASKADGLHPRSRSLSLGSLLSPQLTVVEISESLKSPHSPSGKSFDGFNMETDYLQPSQHLNLTSKRISLHYDNMYGYKDKYENVGKHTDKGIDFLDKYYNFLKKRCEIEQSYANELKKLVKNNQPRKKEEEDYQFTTAQAFLDMLKEVHDMAGQHEMIAESTQQQLMADIKKCVMELRTDRQKALNDGVKFQNQLKESLKMLDAAKKTYERKFQEAERASETFHRADADIHLSRADVEKTRQTSLRKTQEAEESKNEYASQLQTTNRFQHEYYTMLMPQVFQQLQDVDEKRISMVKTVIEGSAALENSVLPILKSCIEGMNKAAQSINRSADSQMFVEKNRTGFQIPGDIPFDDLSSGGSNSNSLNNRNLSPADVTRNDKRTTVKGTGTEKGKKDKKRGGLFKIFGNTAKDEFPNEPAQRRVKLQKKIDEIKSRISHETNEREGMMKMRDVYMANPQLGDADVLTKKLDLNTQTINELQLELKKFEDMLDNTKNELSGGVMRRHGSDDSMTHSINSVDSSQMHPSAPGTPMPQHNNTQEEYYDRRYSYNHRPVEDPVVDHPPPDEFDEYPVIGSCRALYAFDASAEGAVNEGSVSMVENEEMSVLEQDQGDGWTRVRKYNNEEGFVPTTYIQCHFYDQDAV